MANNYSQFDSRFGKRQMKFGKKLTTFDLADGSPVVGGSLVASNYSVLQPQFGERQMKFEKRIRPWRNECCASKASRRKSARLEFIMPAFTVGLAFATTWVIAQLSRRNQGFRRTSSSEPGSQHSLLPKWKLVRLLDDLCMEFFGSGEEGDDTSAHEGMTMLGHEMKWRRRNGMEATLVTSWPKDSAGLKKRKFTKQRPGKTG